MKERAAERERVEKGERESVCVKEKNRENLKAVSMRANRRQWIALK